MPTRNGRRDRSRKPPRRAKRPAIKLTRSGKVPQPLKKRARTSRARKVLIPRPGAWWRTPIAAEKLRDLPPDEAALLIAQERMLRTERVKDTIRELRQFSSDFDAENGYPLDDRKLIRIPAAKIRKLRRAHETLKRATSHPFVTFTPKTKKQKKSAEGRAGKILPGQRKFIIHHSDARSAKAEWKDGEIQITTTVKGGQIFERIYLFRRKPRRWSDVVRFTKDLMRRGMRTGYYKIYNSVYGPIGELVSIDALIDSLEQFFSTYNKWLAGTIKGWVWMSTSLDVARTKQRRQKTTAERFQERRKELQQQEQDRLKRRLGMRVPKRRIRSRRRRR